MLAGCAASHFDARSEGAKLLQRDAEWANLAYEGKDVDRVVSYWSDDAVVMMQGGPVVEGKAAILTMVASSFRSPIFKIHWVSEKPEFSPDGHVAFMRGTDEMTVRGADGLPKQVHMRGVSVWRKDEHGEWRCVIDMANEEPTPKPPL